MGKDLLFHCFPRPRVMVDSDGQNYRLPPQNGTSEALQILASIFKFGLLCAAEKLTITADPLRAPKKPAIDDQSVVYQTRASFTLCEPSQLTQPQALARFVEPGTSESVLRDASHVDLFGSVGIALDPIEARRIGIMPAMYYYSGSTLTDTSPTELLRRLAEARQALLALHLIEEEAGVEMPHTHTSYVAERTSSEQLGLVPSKKEQHETIRRLGRRRAKQVNSLFDYDRRTFWQIVDKLEYLLGLFQDSDSHLEQSPLAFYEQREWRLPYNSQQNTHWFCLGRHPSIRDPLAGEFHKVAKYLVSSIEAGKGRRLSDDELNATWVLHSVDEQPFAQLIKMVVCPNAIRDEVSALMEDAIRFGHLRSDVHLHTH